MATKKQKRAAGIAKQAQEFAKSQESGLKAQREDQQRRAKRLEDARLERLQNTHRRHLNEELEDESTEMEMGCGIGA